MAGARAEHFQVQSVVSDLFHTLVNPDAYRPEGFIRARRIADALGLEEVDEFVGWWRELEAERHVNGSKKVVQYADEYLLKHTGRHCTKEELDHVDQIWGSMHDQALLHPLNEVVSALRELRRRNVKLGLLSNIDEREAVNWPRSPLAPLFDAVSMSCYMGCSKPSGAAYSAVLFKLGADPADSVYVGDGSHDELRGAREAGFGRVVFMKGFISTRGTHNVETVKKRAEEADLTITDLNDLVVLVDRLRG